MSTGVLPKKIELDTDEVVALFALAFGNGAEDVSVLDVKIRYLQKTPFPHGERAGRGKRTIHDLVHTLKLATALSLMDVGATGARATLTTNAYWPLFSTNLADAWSDVMDRAPPEARKAELLLVGLKNLRNADAALDIRKVSKDDVLEELFAFDAVTSNHIVLNPWSLISTLRKGLIDLLRYREEEVEQAFQEFVKSTGG